MLGFILWLDIMTPFGFARRAGRRQTILLKCQLMVRHLVGLTTGYSFLSNVKSFMIANLLGGIDFHQTFNMVHPTATAPPFKPLTSSSLPPSPSLPALSSSTSSSPSPSL